MLQHNGVETIKLEIQFKMNSKNIFVMDKNNNIMCTYDLLREYSLQENVNRSQVLTR